MSRGFPSMTALLGLLAIAGYQNRDKIADMLGGLNKPGSPGQGDVGSSFRDWWRSRVAVVGRQGSARPHRRESRR